MKITYLNPASPGGDLVYTQIYMSDYLKGLGFELVDEGDASIILVTIPDTDSFTSLRAIRKRNPKATIVAGGFEAYSGEWMAAFADYVVVGKGERFMNELWEGKDIPADLPEVFTAESVYSKACYPYEETEIESMPIVTVGKQSMYAVAGFGCKSKCVFCMTSWAQEHRSAGSNHIRRLADFAGKQKKRVTFVANDYDLFKYGRSVNAQSVMVRDILADEDAFIKMLRESKRGMLHLGVEGFNEPMRRKLSKPVKNADIYRVLEIMSNYNLDVELFFIAGLPGDGQLDEINVMFPTSAKRHPRIFLKFTTLNPCPHTPLWTVPLDSIGELTNEMVVDWYQRFAMKHNAQIRTFGVRTPAKEVWRSVLRRCEPDQVAFVPKFPKTDAKMVDFIAAVRKAGLSNTIDVTGRELPNSHIITPLRDRLAKATARWEMPEPILRNVERKDAV